MPRKKIVDTFKFLKQVTWKLQAIYFIYKIENKSAKLQDPYFRENPSAESTKMRNLHSLKPK